MINTTEQLNQEMKTLFGLKDSEIEKANHFTDSYGYSAYIAAEILPNRLKNQDLKKIEKMFLLLNDALENGDHDVKSLVISGYFEDLAQKEEYLDLAKKYLSTEAKEYMNSVSLKYSGVRRAL